MSEADEALEWVKYAEEDLILAKGAEKYLKAILVSQTIEFPKTHDLLILNTLCINAGIFTGFTKEDLGRLSGYAIHTRYPGNQPTPKEAKEALEIEVNVRKFARTFLGLKK